MMTYRDSQGGEEREEGMQEEKKMIAGARTAAASPLTARVRRAKEAALAMAQLSLAERHAALEACAEALYEFRDRILAANRSDCARAASEGLSEALTQRLRFDAHKLEGAREGLLSLLRLPDPKGRVELRRELAEGLILERVSVPLGLIGVVFEARPDALVQIAALCLKSGNALILKGGAEARESNRALFEALTEAGRRRGLPEAWMSLLEAREEVSALLDLDEYVDLLIPRGSNAFVRHIMDHTRIPVLGHADGVCHTYIDGDCAQDEALATVLDAKTQYTSVCNATECVLLDEALEATDFPERLAAALREKGCRIYGDARLCARLGAEAVSDWHTEYLDLALSMRFVAGLDEAVAHINRYGSGHTDAILTRSAERAERFMNEVDSGNVFWNCSTRFSDGFRYGFGAEVGVSTSKIHARGPVGLEGLMSYKYKLCGHGDRVGDFAAGKRTFTHRDLGCAEESC